MRRLFAVWIILALLMSCGAAVGEERMILTEFEDFLLQTKNVPAYIGEKSDGQPLFLFYPSTEGNITMTAVNAVWSRMEEPMTREAFSEMYRASEAGIRAQYESAGNRLTGFEVGEAVEKELWGFPALLCDAELTVSINDTDVCLVQRGMIVTGAFGTYLFSLSAWSEELLEQATEALIQAVQWKE